MFCANCGKTLREEAGFCKECGAPVPRAEDVPMAIAKRLPRYPLLPATLIGRLAIDGVRQGEGFGRLLLMDALFRSWQAAQTVASYAVRVDATDEAAREFYLRHDFLFFPSEHLKLFFPMADLDRLFLGEF